MRSFFIALCFIIMGIFTINSTNAQVAAVKFTVIVPPFDSQNNLKVHLAGSFNGWNSHDSLYIMKPEGGNTYSLIVPLFEGESYNYKYTLGNWNTVETKMNDSDITNRQLYSKNGMVIYDTVLKWKTPPALQSKTLSPQMQKIMAVRDSAKAQLQVTLSKLLVVLKEYNENMLSPKPNKRLHKKQKKQTIEMLARLYNTVESKIWEIGTSLSPEQKQKILAAIKNPNNPKDVLTTLGNAYGDALK
jgi:hypothetical protein